MVKAKVGKRLQEYRKKRGLTQEELAEQINVSTNYLSAVERGVNQLDYDKLVAVMNVLRCSADDIFCDTVVCSAENRVCRLASEIGELPEGMRAKVQDTMETLEWALSVAAKK